MEIKRKTIENDEKYLRQISKEVLFSDKSLKSDVKKLESFSYFFLVKTRKKRFIV